MLHGLITWLVDTVGSMGYPGIIFLMFLESSFFPFPSEVVIPPAGYLAHQGEMHLSLVIFSGITGSVLGALFNYWISITVGRSFFEKYGRYLMISRSSLDKAEIFFDRHGHISTLIGRLIPVIRQYISLPAGVARMALIPFCTFTAIGSGIWVTILALVGYWLGSQGDLALRYIHRISLVLILLCVIATAVYIAVMKKRRSSERS